MGGGLRGVSKPAGSPGAAATGVGWWITSPIRPETFHWLSCDSCDAILRHTPCVSSLCDVPVSYWYRLQSFVAFIIDVVFCHQCLLRCLYGTFCVEKICVSTSNIYLLASQQNKPLHEAKCQWMLSHQQQQRARSAFFGVEHRMFVAIASKSGKCPWYSFTFCYAEHTHCYRETRLSLVFRTFSVPLYFIF